MRHKYVLRQIHSRRQQLLGQERQPLLPLQPFLYVVPYFFIVPRSKISPGQKLVFEKLHLFLNYLKRIDE